MEPSSVRAVHTEEGTLNLHVLGLAASPSLVVDRGIARPREESYGAPPARCGPPPSYHHMNEKKITHLGLIVSRRFASWMSQALRMIVVKMSPRGMPSVQASSSAPPTPCPFVSCGDRLERMDGPSAGWRDAGTAWKYTRSCSGRVAMSYGRRRQ